MKKLKYKLKLSKGLLTYLSFVRNTHKIRVCGGPYKDFNIRDLLTDDELDYFSGCHFVSNGKHHIFINPIQTIKTGHDLVVLHEIGHMFLHENHFHHQEESFANGFAFAMAKSLGLKIVKSMRDKLVIYSELHLKASKKHRYRRRPEVTLNTVITKFDKKKKPVYHLRHEK